MEPRSSDMKVLFGPMKSVANIFYRIEMATRHDSVQILFWRFAPFAITGGSTTSGSSFQSLSKSSMGLAWVILIFRRMTANFGFARALGFRV